MIADRFWSKVDKDGPVPDPAVYGDIGPCWVWTAGKVTGYGRIRWNGRLWLATHVALVLSGTELALGNDRMVLHACDNRACVRASHLRIGTRSQNALDAVHRGEWPRARHIGADNGAARLSEPDVVRILTSEESGAALAARYGVSRSAVSLIRRRKTWAHVEART